MNFGFTEEQDALRREVRRFLDDSSPEAEVRRLMITEEGYDPAVWSKMASGLGLQGLVIPEEYGGSGASWAELGIVLEEMGRSLFCGPFFSTVVLGATALIESEDTAAMKELLPGIANGSTIATLALTEDSGGWDEASIALRAAKSGDGYTLDGHKSYVIDGLIANLIIVAARTTNGVSLFTVEGGAKGLTKSPFKTLDLTRKLARLEFDGVPAKLLGTDGDGWTVLERVLDLAAIGLAAEQVGGAQTTLDMAVEYAKTRIAFGQPIGSFQAIKHKCADMFLELESAKSAAYYSWWAASERNEELPAVASLVKSYCSDAFALLASENIQIHGGIGFTWEVPAHLYLKRARSMELYLGDPQYHRKHLFERILGESLEVPAEKQ